MIRSWNSSLGKDNVWKLYSDQREGDITAPMQEVCEAELEDFDFAVDGSLSPNVEHSLDADDTQFFVDKDIRDSEWSDADNTNDRLGEDPWIGENSLWCMYVDVHHRCYFWEQSS